MSYIEKVLALSTMHMPSESPDFGACRVVLHEYGYIVFVQDYLEHVGATTDGMPPWMTKIMMTAIDEDCTLIMFDRDCKVADFPTYEWGEHLRVQQAQWKLGRELAEAVQRGEDVHVAYERLIKCDHARPCLRASCHALLDEVSAQ